MKITAMIIWSAIKVAGRVRVIITEETPTATSQTVTDLSYLSYPVIVFKKKIIKRVKANSPALSEHKR